MWPPKSAVIVPSGVEYQRLAEELGLLMVHSYKYLGATSSSEAES